MQPDAAGCSQMQPDAARCSRMKPAEMAAFGSSKTMKLETVRCKRKKLQSETAVNKSNTAINYRQKRPPGTAVKCSEKLKSETAVKYRQ